jgi:LysM repeat protein
LPTTLISTVYEIKLKYFYSFGEKIYFYTTGDGKGKDGTTLTNIESFIKTPGTRCIFFNLPTSHEKFDGSPDDPPNFEELMVDSNGDLNNPRKSKEYTVSDVTAHFVFVLTKPVSYPTYPIQNGVYYKSIAVDRIFTVLDRFVFTSHSLSQLLKKGDEIVIDLLPSSDPIDKTPYDTLLDEAPHKIPLKVMSFNILTKQIYFENTLQSTKYLIKSKILINFTILLFY